MLKRIFALFTWICAICGALTVMPIYTEAKEEIKSGNYTYTLTRGEATITAFDESSCEDMEGVIRVPSALDGYPVISIGDMAFYNCCKITSVYLPNSLTSIGNSAFAYCDRLANVSIPNSVKNIGDNAFSGCDSLISITISDSVISISDTAFFHCIALSNIEVSADNSKYKSENGILFNKDMTELIKYPENNSNT